MSECPINHDPGREQIAALAWLDRAILFKEAQAFATHESDKHRAVIKAMLAEPRLPEEAPNDTMLAVCHAVDCPPSFFAKFYRALRAHLTKPKTKTVEVWHVQYSFREFEALDWKPQTSIYPDTPEGRRERDGWLASFKGDKRIACIRVTGPHQQEVPA